MRGEGEQIEDVRSGEKANTQRWGTATSKAFRLHSNNQQRSRRQAGFGICSFSPVAVTGPNSPAGPPGQS